METQTAVGKLSATRREETGKGMARKLRQKGLIPAVCYGHNRETLSITVDPLELHKALDPRKRQNTVIDLTITEGERRETLKVMLKQHQIDTLKQTLLHADFIQVMEDIEVQVAVPLQLQGKPEGVKLGGNLHQVFRTLPVKCMPGKIPAAIDVEVSHLNVNESVQVKDLAQLPEGVKVCLPLNQTVALVLAPRKVLTVAEGAEAAPAAEGEEGASAEGEKKEEQPEEKDKKDKKEKKEKKK
jgi:large subunit ribosomal protein L25